MFQSRYKSLIEWYKIDLYSSGRLCCRGRGERYRYPGQEQGDG